MTQLYRCRVFQTHPPEVIPPKGMFTRIVDTLDDPDELDPQPPGEVVLELFHTDAGFLHRMVEYCLKRQCIKCGYWRMRVLIDEDLIETIPLFPITRCRLYLLKRKLKCGSPRFAEVWDTLGEPYEIHRRLPRGKLIASTQSRSAGTVRYRISKLWSRYNIWGYGKQCTLLRANYVEAC